MSRADRRADAAVKRRFQRQTQGEVISHLFEVGERIEGRPHADIVARTVADFYRSPSGCCFCCKGDYGRCAAFLVAHAAVRPRTAALAVACPRCWNADDYLDVLSDAAEVTLRKLLPGHWLEPLPANKS